MVLEGVEIMNTERFVGVSPEEDTLYIYDREDNNKHLNLEEMLDMLNEQDQKIKYLLKVIVLLKHELSG